MSSIYSPSRRLVFQSVPQVLKNSPLLEALAAFANIYVTSRILSLSLNVSLLIVPLAAATVYGLNRYTDLAEDQINQPKRVGGLVQRSFYVFAISSAYLIAIGLALVYGSVESVVLTLLPAVCGILYSVPLLPLRSFSRLKEVFLVNSVMVAGAWAISLTYLPLTISNRAIPSVAALSVAAFWFLRYFSGVETCNVPDIRGDRHEGIDTIPTRFGVAKTQRILYTLDLLSLVPLVVIAYVYPPSFPVLVLVPAVLYSMLCTGMLRYRSFRQLSATITDTQYLLMAALVFLGLHVF